MNTDEIFDKIWAEFVSRLKAFRNETPKVTYEKIGQICGVSKVTVKRWVEGAGGEKTPFPDMLRYMQAVDMDISGVIPSEVAHESMQGETVSHDKARIAELQGKTLAMQSEIDKMKIELSASQKKIIHQSGAIEALERQLEKYRELAIREDLTDKKTA